MERLHNSKVVNHVYTKYISPSGASTLSWATTFSTAPTFAERRKIEY
jgi:hypothetical protein